MPENISAGFYGPDKIVAIRPKKLVFTDYGAWSYIYDNSLPQDLKRISNLIIFDLEECTWTSQGITLDPENGQTLFNFPSASYSSYGSEYYSYSVKWE